QALDLGRGVMRLTYVDPDRPEPQWRTERFSQHLACDQCGRSYEPLNPHHYSFNSPLGWCPTCEGLGFQRGANVNLLLRDTALSLRAGAVAAWPPLDPGSAWLPFAEALARHGGFSLDVAFKELEPAVQRLILHGSGDAFIELTETPASGGRRPPVLDGTGDDSRPPLARFQYKGLFPAVDEASRVSFIYRAKLDQLVDEVPCSTCHGSRLRTDSAATRFQNLSLGDLCAKPLGETLRLFDGLKPAKADRQIAGEVLREVASRLKFLVDVGLDYLSLDRKSPTLSGGEAQRIRLASQIGSGLTGVLYVLDEPTIGLHPRDNARLLTALHRLRDLGNTLLLVEHDREVIAAADCLFDFGPGAGDLGGEVTAFGPPAKVRKSKASLTGRYLSGELAIPVPTNRRIARKESSSTKKEQGTRNKGQVEHPTPESLRNLFLFPCEMFLSVLGARQHNLRNVDVHVPLGALVAVTGVSGSGKSSLVNEVLYNTLARRLHRARTVAAAHDDLRGIENLDKIINVDQDPIGNAPSSNPATYTGVFDLIRELFARLPESKVRGYQPRRFSFNQKGGRCEACEGNGQKKIEMHFLPDVWVECDVCHGSRYNPETLAVKYHGKSITDVLNMRVAEALELFGNLPKIRVILQTLADVGLGYMSLGQPAPTMSGGEAQRVKLAAELARPSTGRTLYLLDEPTTGLHFDDVRKLLDVLHRLVDLGNTVVVVEHNLDVIKTADWVIDMGPEAGSGGGRVVAQGTPEAIIGSPESHTARILADVLAAGPHTERVPFDPAAALAKREGDIEIAQVGKGSALPWEADGKRWHTADRVTTKGTTPKWDGPAVAVVEELVQAQGGFSPTTWTNRSMVEVAAQPKTLGWFLHALTGHEGYLTLTFRVGKNAFKTPDLTAKLGLKPLQDFPGFEMYARDKRVEAANGRGPWQEVTVTVVRQSEVETPAFRAFVKQAAAAFHAQIARLKSSPEDLMPWKTDGAAWHLGPKGFPPGKKPKWDASVLKKFFEIVAEVDPDIETRWDTRDAVSFAVPDVSRAWGRIRTKDPAAVECRFVGKPGQFNLARVERIGRDPEVTRDKAEGADVLTLRFVTADQLRPAELRKLLAEHLTGFRATFGE
ncbi:MAG: excinuclease ABC subunit UvrA, partial [Fimbriiglobus sp.]